MPRRYERQKGSRKYADYTQENLDEAIRKIRSGEMSNRKAAKHYKISISTIKRRLKGVHLKRPGGQTILDEETEKMFADHVVTCSLFGYPMTGFDIRVLVKSYLDRNGLTISSFKNNLPGKEWYKSFMSRHRDLTERISSNIKKQRAKVSTYSINEYFDYLEQEIVNVPPSNIFNFDETNLTDDPGNLKIVTKRGVKYPERILNSTKSSTSIMMCGNAEGTMLPPYVVYKSKELWTTWTEGGPSGCRYNRTSSGWFDNVTFDDWFNTVVIPHLKKLSGTKVVIGDNLSSHLNLNIIELCQKHDIKFICLPPNSSHISQPLDVAYFRSMKGAWRRILTDYKVKTNKSPVPKSDFPKLLKQLVTELHHEGSNSLVNGFRKTGIYPVNRKEILDRLPTKDSLPNKKKGSHDGEELKQRVSDSVLEFLHKKRYGEGNEKVGRKKKVQVKPGKSVSADDFKGENNKVPEAQPSTSTGTFTSPPIKATAKRKKKAVKRDSDTSSESEPESEYSVYSEFEEEDFDDIDFLIERQQEKGNSKKIEVKGSSKKQEEKGIVKKKENLKKKDSTGAYEKGSYVLVMYEGEFFPGVITDIGTGNPGEDYKISTMTMSGPSNWKWPDKIDECWYNRTEIKEKIAAPTPITARGSFAVPEVEKWRFMDKDIKLNA